MKHIKAPAIVKNRTCDDVHRVKYFVTNVKYQLYVGLCVGNTVQNITKTQCKNTFLKVLFPSATHFSDHKGI